MKLLQLSFFHQAQSCQQELLSAVTTRAGENSSQGQTTLLFCEFVFESFRFGQIQNS